MISAPDSRGSKRFTRLAIVPHDNSSTVFQATLHIYTNRYCWSLTDFMQNVEWHFCLMLFMASVVRRSSITKWAAVLAHARFDLEYPNCTRISTPSWSTATSDTTSLVTSGQKLWRKTAENAVCDGFGSASWVRFKPGSRNFTVNNQLHKPAGYDVASCFRSAAKCNWILHRSAQKRVQMAELNNSVTVWRKITNKWHRMSA